MDDDTKMDGASTQGPTGDAIPLNPTEPEGSSDGQEERVISLESSQSTPRSPLVSPPPERSEELPQRILIVGSAHGWETAPFDDPSWAVWSLSRMYTGIPRWDAWFEIHPYDRLCERLDGETPKPAQERQRADYHRWLSVNHGKPIFMQEVHPAVPSSVKYPLEMIKQTFPHPYFTNTVGYMLAYACAMRVAHPEDGPKEIGIWGIDMATEEEYQTQRPGVEYWVGVAVGLGIRVTIPEVSDLVKSRVLYGWGNDELFTKLTYKRDMHGRTIKEADKAIEHAKLTKAQATGAKQTLDWIIDNF